MPSRSRSRSSSYGDRYSSRYTSGYDSGYGNSYGRSHRSSSPFWAPTPERYVYIDVGNPGYAASITSDNYLRADSQRGPLRSGNNITGRTRLSNWLGTQPGAPTPPPSVDDTMPRGRGLFGSTERIRPRDLSPLLSSLRDRCESSHPRSPSPRRRSPSPLRRGSFPLRRLSPLLGGWADPRIPTYHAGAQDWDYVGSDDERVLASSRRIPGGRRYTSYDPDIRLSYLGSGRVGITDSR